jgi:hypothetical protein
MVFINKFTHTHTISLAPPFSPTLSHSLCCCLSLTFAPSHLPLPHTLDLFQLGVYNAGYVTGGTLMIIALIIMLWLLSKHADVVLESKLARPEAGQ